MSAALSNASAQFVLGDVNIHLSCSSPTELLAALREFGKAPAANDPVVTPGKSAKGATAPATPPAQPPVASSAPAAAAQGAEGNGATTATPGTAQPAAGGSASGGEAGNGAAAGQAAAAASSSTSAASPEVTFDVLKKAFLALSTATPDGRAKCEAVLKPFGVAKLSEAKPEQYAGVLAVIEKAAV